MRLWSPFCPASPLSCLAKFRLFPDLDFRLRFPIKDVGNDRLGRVNDVGNDGPGRVNNVGDDGPGRVLRVWVDCDTVDGAFFGMLTGLGVC